MMRLLAQTNFKTMPWKNGGGETVEIMSWPEGAPVSDFEWRISMAHVAHDGPFSNFPNIDRHLVVLKGNGLILQVGNAPACRLKPDSPAYAFPGDSPTMATLSDGPIQDLNVMVRRGHWRAALVDHLLNETFKITINLSYALLFVQDGTLTCATHDTCLTATGGDAVLFEQQAGDIILEPNGLCRIWQIDLHQIAGP